MTKILLNSSNEIFAEDLRQQLLKLIEPAIFVTEYPDIVIIDEDVDSSELRTKYPAVPFIYLVNEIKIVQDNLNIALKKPFSLIDLIDLVQAANNKLDNSTDGYLFFNGYELKPSTKEIVDLAEQRTIKLTEKEVDILQYLYKMPDIYVSKADLQKNVWKYHEEVTTHTVETHIYRLRQKVEQKNNRRLILTENGGYKLNRD